MIDDGCGPFEGERTASVGSRGTCQNTWPSSPFARAAIDRLSLFFIAPIEARAGAESLCRCEPGSPCKDPLAHLGPGERRASRAIERAARGRGPVEPRPDGPEQVPGEVWRRAVAPESSARPVTLSRSASTGVNQGRTLSFVFLASISVIVGSRASGTGCVSDSPRGSDSSAPACACASRTGRTELSRSGIDSVLCVCRATPGIAREFVPCRR